MTTKTHFQIRDAVLDRIRRMDFRFDGNPNESHRFEQRRFSVGDISVMVEFLFEYRTTSERVFPGTMTQPSEWNVTTHVTRLLESYVYFEGVEYRPDDLIETIENEMAGAVDDALETTGRNSTTTI